MAGTSKIRWRRDVEALAKLRGWAIEPTKAGHFKLKLGDHVVIAAGSPRNPSRSMANMMARMKRYEHDTR
jgi:hypothetical protein